MITDAMVERYVRRLLDQPLYVRLYVGAKEFEEASGGGYAAHVATLQDWTITVNARTALAEGRVFDFKFDGTKRLQIAGAYITDGAMGVYWAKAFEEVKPVGRAGDVIPVRPIFKLGVVA